MDNMALKGTTLAFTKRVEGSPNSIGEPTHSLKTIKIDDCLIEPLVEPQSAREQQAVTAGKRLVRIHLPKADDSDVSDSEVTWDGHIYRVYQAGDSFMAENTPTRWNRYFTAEEING